MSNAVATLGRRAHLPAILFIGDLAVALQVSRATAARWLREGRLGSPIQVGRRRAILRETLLAHLRAMEEEGADDSPLQRSASDPLDSHTRKPVRTPRRSQAR